MDCLPCLLTVCWVLTSGLPLASWLALECSGHIVCSLEGVRRSQLTNTPTWVPATQSLCQNKVPPSPGSVEDATCCVCLDQPRNLVLIPCGHLCLCVDCGRHGGLKECPLCRVRITKRLRVYP